MSTVTAKEQSVVRSKSEDQKNKNTTTVPIGVITDLELIEVALQAGIDLEKEIHFFMIIEDVML